MKGRVLVAGFATRHIAQSAYRAGYEVYAIDHFCDQDLGWYTKECRRFEELDEIPDLASEFASARRFDIFVAASGAEVIGHTIPFYGSPPSVAGKFLDKLEIQYFFEEHDIPAPPLLSEGMYPAMVKPRHGAGGWRNAVVSNREEEEVWTELFPDTPYLRQAVAEGVPASVSCVANGRNARAVAVNRQLIRGGSERRYGFSGAATPYDTPMREEMIQIAERAAALSGCVGSLGIDFIVDDNRTFAIEINPRFQATLDTVEMVTGMSVFGLHVDACRGTLPPATPPARCHAVRSILFAEDDGVVRDDLAGLSPAIADIPREGAEYEAGSALVSAYGWGRSDDDALAMLDKTITTLRRYISRW